MSTVAQQWPAWACSAWSLLLIAFMVVGQGGAAPLAVSVQGRPDPLLVSVHHQTGLRFVDVTELAPALDLIVTRHEDRVTFRNRNSEEWTGRLGDYVLDGPRRMIMRGPLLRRESSIYTTLEDAAEITDSDLRVVEAEGEAAFTTVASRGPSAGTSGWDEFTLEKTEEEKNARRLYDPTEPIEGRSLRDVKGPPQRDALWVQLGQGYVQGADFGTDLSGAGNLSGFNSNFWLQTTQGSQGLELLTGHASLRAPSDRWGVEGGDLFSDIWGWARGGRLSWNAGERRSPSISYYAQARQRGHSRNVFAYSDQFRVNRWLTLSGEGASDGSAMGRLTLGDKRFRFSPFYRHSLGEDSSRGVYGSMRLFSGVSAFGGYTFSQTALGYRKWTRAGLRIPVKRKVSLTVERTLANSSSNVTKLSALSASFPVGKIRFYSRYQIRDTEIRRSHLGFPPMRIRNHEILSAFSYRAGRKLNVQLQTSNRWRQDGAVEQVQQVVGSYRPSNKTAFEVFSILPTATTRSQSRIRLIRQISQTFALITEWGNVSPYQGIEADPEEERFKVMIRKQWPIQTPTRGGEVQGVVTDSLGRPLEDVVVRLGEYGIRTDDRGVYRFERVPNGVFEVSVDELSLPVDYAVLNPPRELEIGLRSEARVDFSVTPLHVIQGRVCWDKNDNGQCDSGEGLHRIPVFLGRRVTATQGGGVFMFHNLAPGSHTVRLRLGANRAREWVIVSPDEVTVEVEAGIASGRVEFLLKKQQKEIIFQALD